MEHTVVGLRITRRELFAGAASLAAPAYLAGSGAGRLLAGAPWSPGRGVTLSLAAFSQVVGTRFRVRTGSFRFVDLTLAEAEGHPERTGGAPVVGESFSLIFSGPSDARIDGGTYKIGHAAFGWFPLALAPVGMAREGQQYEAVINRRVPASR